MRAFLVLFALAMSARLLAVSVPDVIIDEDGGIDDLVAISLLLKSTTVHVRAIAICPGNSYLEPATRATELVVERLGGRNITIVQGRSEGINPFPVQWRKDAARVLEIPALAGAPPKATNSVVPNDAAHYLAKLLSGGQLYTILETGPLTNIADALKIDPSIKRHISRIYVMGGAVRVRGNVEQPGYSGSAEWNIFNQPQAAADVIGSGIPITLVPLDATNKVPMTRQFVDRLAAQPSVASQLAAQAMRLAITSAGTVPYYFWDPLTAAALLDPSIITTERLKIRVVTNGASEGRTVEDPRGSPLEVAIDASREKVEKMFFDLLGR